MSHIDTVREFVYNDIDSKRSTTWYLHEPPVLVEDVNEIS